MFPICKKCVSFAETEINHILLLTGRIFSQLSEDLQRLLQLHFYIYWLHFWQLNQL